MPYFYTTFEPWKTHVGLEISGSLGGVYDPDGHRIDGAITFKRQKRDPGTGKFITGRGVLALHYVAPANPQTDEQQYQRNKLTMAITAWQDLSENEKEEWRQKAGRSTYATGANMFVSRYLRNFENWLLGWEADFDDW